MARGTIDSELAHLDALLQARVNALHQAADSIVSGLESRQAATLEEDSPRGDRARALLEGARAWRALVEGAGI